MSDVLKQILSTPSGGALLKPEVDSQVRLVNNVLVGEWANASYAFADDGQCTSTASDGAVNRYNFINNPFTIPAGATVTGLQALIRWGGDGDDQFEVWLVDDGGVGHGKGGTPPLHVCADAVLVSGGGDGDLWGSTRWPPSHINSSSFVCYIRYVKTGKAGTMYIDFVEITVYYTLPI